jgi:hypothetical protein
MEIGMNETGNNGKLTGASYDPGYIAKLTKLSNNIIIYHFHPSIEHKIVASDNPDDPIQKFYDEHFIEDRLKGYGYMLDALPSYTDIVSMITDQITFDQYNPDIDISDKIVSSLGVIECTFNKEELLLSKEKYSNAINAMFDSLDGIQKNMYQKALSLKEETTGIEKICTEFMVEQLKSWNNPAISLKFSSYEDIQNQELENTYNQNDVQDRLKIRDKQPPRDRDYKPNWDRE